MKLLELRDISIHYEKVQAVNGVSIDVTHGSIVSLIGNNGAGKSTILRTIFGLKRPTTGEIWFDNNRIDGRSPQAIASQGIAYCLEGRRLFPQMSVLENLEMGAYLRTDKPEIQKDIQDIFRLFPILKERQGQNAKTLSGGQQQMLAIARALMSKPRMLLLDEPSLGLAPQVIKEIGTIIQDINSRGVSILLVEQNSKLALGVAQMGYVLETGSVYVHGTSKNLIENEHVKKAYLGG